ncbi:MAG: inositol monophosphatase [Deltaproteobacteria bacterium]|nr:inositol monophosphatase [Deltaproteobacteria bacterium]
MELDELAEAARAAARAARDLLRTARPEHVRAKGNPRDLVTEWDLRSEELIRRVLAERTPGIPILGEEGGQGAGSANGLRWLVDPIDGTVNFAHGLPLWCVSIALEQHDTIACGVVVAPALDWWFEATLGGGARDGTGAALRVSPTQQLEHALLATGFPYDRATNPDNNFATWEHMKRVATVRRLGAAALDLCLVAKGALDGYWETRLQPWDLAAGALIVAEAGGTVTDTRGGPFDPHSGEAAATNGAIHEGLVRELGQVRR